MDQQNTFIRFDDEPTGPMFRTARVSEDAVERELDEKPAAALLRAQLSRLTDWLLHDNVEEICVNRPGEVWQKLRRPEKHGEPWKRSEAPALTRDYLERMCFLIANSQNIPDFGPDLVPVVYGSLPGGHRFSAGLGSNFQYGGPNEYDNDGTVCLCVRQFTPQSSVELTDYRIHRDREATESLSSVFTKATDPRTAMAQVMNSLTRGDHILVSGMTGCGKTTLIKRLIEYIGEGRRIISVEDTRELVIPHLNRVQVLMSRTQQANRMTYAMVRDLVVRMTPDVVLAGEISNANAATIWDLMTTGHGHFMTTVHADSPEEAITTFMGCIEHARGAAGITAPLDKEELERKMRDKLRVIQMKKDDAGRRYVSGIL